jgi:hypothetical protein
VQSNIRRFAVNHVIVCETFATSGGIAFVSVSGGQELSVGIDAATQVPTLQVSGGVSAVRAGAGGRTMPFEAQSPIEPQAGTPPAQDQACMPLFGTAYRVSRAWWPTLGLRKHLVNLQGGPALVYDTSKAEEELIPDENDPEANIDYVSQLPIDELFERVEPRQIDLEIRQETELNDEGVPALA